MRLVQLLCAFGLHEECAVGLGRHSPTQCDRCGRIRRPTL
jgi:hypothetical protein